MNRYSNQVLLLASVWLLPNLLFASNLELTPTLYYFNYHEFDQSNRLLDKEQGVLPGIRLSFNPVQQAEDIKAHVSLYGGRVDYTGQIKTGFGSPLPVLIW